MSGKLMKKPSAIKELALWVLIGLFLSAMALSAVGAAKYVFGWSESQWVAGSVTLTLFSITWGSWAALLWTHSRVLKSLMVVVTALPGALMAIFGVWAFFNMPENPWVWRAGWLVVAGHGVGALAVVVLMAGRRMVARTQIQTRPRRLAIGWTLYPLLVVVGGVTVLAVSFALLPDLFCGEATTMASVARWVVPSQAIVLGTTVMPAAAVQICHFLTRQRDA